jgi:hypothetical protein
MTSNICKNRTFMIDMIDLFELDNCEVISKCHIQATAVGTHAFDFPQHLQRKELIAIRFGRRIRKPYEPATQNQIYERARSKRGWVSYTRAKVPIESD